MHHTLCLRAGLLALGLLISACSPDAPTPKPATSVTASPPLDAASAQTSLGVKPGPAGDTSSQGKPLDLAVKNLPPATTLRPGLMPGHVVSEGR